MSFICNPSTSTGGGGGSGTVTGGSSEGAGQAVFDAANSTSSTLFFKSITSTGNTLTVTNTATTVNADLNTPVTVPSGGTGTTSVTAYMPLLGGTTTTGAFQSVATSTSGYPLVYNGSSSVPTFSQLGAGALNTTGTPSSTTFLRGDFSWQTPAGGSGISLGLVQVISKNYTA